jgi:hypothetical protein
MSPSNGFTDIRMKRFWSLPEETRKKETNPFGEWLRVQIPSTPPLKYLNIFFE